MHTTLQQTQNAAMHYKHVTFTIPIGSAKHFSARQQFAASSQSGSSELNSPPVLTGAHIPPEVCAIVSDSSATINLIAGDGRARATREKDSGFRQRGSLTRDDRSLRARACYRARVLTPVRYEANVYTRATHAHTPIHARHTRGRARKPQNPFAIGRPRRRSDRFSAAMLFFPRASFAADSRRNVCGGGGCPSVEIRFS